MKVKIKEEPEESLGEGVMVSELYSINDGYAVVDVFFHKNAQRDTPVLVERVPWHRIELYEKLKRSQEMHIYRGWVPGEKFSEVLLAMFAAYADRPMIGSKPSELGVPPSKDQKILAVQKSDLCSPWIWTTFREEYERVMACGAVLKAMGVPLGSFVGICAKNSRAYIEAQMGLMVNGYVCVPLSLSLSDDNTIHIMLEANIKAAFIGPEQEQKYQRLFKICTEEKKHAITMVPLSEKAVDQYVAEYPVAEGMNELRKRVREKNKVLTISLEDFLGDDDKEGAKKKPKIPKTGQKSSETDPKISGKSSAPSEVSPDKTRGADDAEKDEKDKGKGEKKIEPRIILYTSGSTGRPKGAVMSDEVLTLEITKNLYLVDWNGTEVGIYDSPAAVSSSFYNMMAYLLNGGRCGIFADLSEAFDHCQTIGPSSLGMVPQKWNILFKRYQARINQGEDKKSLDEEFKKILGWRVTYLNCGGATPIPAVQKWLKATYPNCKVTENYAATECGGITNSKEGDMGLIKEGVQVRLEDWGEYKTTDKPYPRGEICVKTTLRASGYLNRPDLTAQAWDKDGYYHTGDIGELIDDKHVRIIDRKKNVFKLANGEWVSPENVENVYLSLDVVHQIFIHGTSRHSKVIALVVRSKKEEAKSLTDSKLIDILKEKATAVKLRHFEVPGAVAFVDQAFNEEDGTMTQSGKLCRWKIRKDHDKVIKALLQSVQLADEKLAESRRDTLGGILHRAVNGTTNPDDLKEWDKAEWDSISAMLTQGLIEAEFKATVPLAQLLGVRDDLALVADLIKTAMKGGIEAPKKTDWVEEAKLPSDLAEKDPTDTKRLAVAKKGEENWLVTGTTGYLGAAILRRLMADVKASGKGVIYVLAREKKKKKAVIRVRESLRRRGYDVKLFEDHLKKGSVVVVAGDLSKPKLGMSPHTYGLLATHITTIFHCGSLVNHVWEYSMLRAANVLGTTEIMRLALDPRGAVPTLHYVSTISVINNGDENTIESPDILDNMGGYAQSKWVAEGRVRAAAAKGLLPATIHRPGLIGPDTWTGSANTNDWLIRFISGSILIGGYLVADTKANVCVTPVNHAAVMQLALSRSYDAALLKTERKSAALPCPTYHTPITKKTNTLSLLENIEASPELLGRRIRQWDPQEWKESLSELPPNNPLFPFKDGFKAGLGNVPSHDAKQTRVALKHALDSGANLEMPAGSGGVHNAVLLGSPSGYTSDEVNRTVRFIMAANKLTADRPLLMRTQSLSRENHLAAPALPDMVRSVSVAHNT